MKNFGSVLLMLVWTLPACWGEAQAGEGKRVDELVSFMLVVDHWGKSRVETLRAADDRALREAAKTLKTECEDLYNVASKNPDKALEEKKNADEDWFGEPGQPRTRIALMRFASDRGSFKEGEIEGKPVRELLSKPRFKQSRNFKIRADKWAELETALKEAASTRAEPDKKNPHASVIKEYLKLLEPAEGQ